MSARFRLEDLPPAMRDQARRELDLVPRETPTPSRSKYGNQVCLVEGETFESKWELKRFRELQEQQRAGLIVGLRHHVSFPLHVVMPSGDRIRIGEYEADMVYRRVVARTSFDHANPDPMPPALALGFEQTSALVIEDTKSETTRKTKIYRWKAQHFELEYGLRVLDVVRVRRTRRNREVRCA
ncbi:MAG TPA: hypothetical protein VFX20_18245 [Steroidobacteraceae bacterium]|nr:hypothetical protein [Steroidobacteraceae bacterium]